jgi:hypothetical protein
MSGRHNVNPPSRTPLCRLWIIHLVAGRWSAKAVEPLAARPSSMVGR